MKTSSPLALGFGIVMGCALFNFWRFYGLELAKEEENERVVVEMASGLAPPSWDLDMKTEAHAGQASTNLAGLLKLSEGGGDAGATSPPVESSCNPRVFVSYTSSPWESLWLSNIREWQAKKYVCDALFDQLEDLFKFQWQTCSWYPDGDDGEWCMKDDSLHQLWWNKKEGRTLTFPPPGKSPGPLSPVIPEDPSIFSRFVFKDACKGGEEYTEYIEPLTSHLRHPTSGCGTKFCLPEDCKPNQGGGKYFYDRSWVVPPPRLREGVGKKLYYDAGASTWDGGQGGNSLGYFTTVWARHGVEFDRIEAWEGTTPPPKFYDSVPAAFKDRVFYHQELIASTQGEAGPFVPDVIEEQAEERDYVLWKLDIDSGPVEQGNIDFLLSSPEHLRLIDEVVWEHHVKNYFMPHWDGGIDETKEIGDSYELFLRMRQAGIRAHSWI
mmetsp:Transcript_13699/g.27295  ORF Transcript_13699/g.27295 Transcript_13699/m.27295 type:complete len:438 (-) Transcript_13699:33-1346(-)